MPADTRWALARSGSIAMSCLPKCASSSIRSSPLFFRDMFNSEVLTVPVRVAWIRNPLSRLQSAYCHFKHHNERGTNSQSHYIGPGVTPSWEVFVDHILLNSNKHWDSQVGMLTLDGLYLATVTERFEDISKRFGHYMPEGLELTNESIKCKTSTYRKADIAAKYKEDFALWRSLGRDKKS